MEKQRNYLMMIVQYILGIMLVGTFLFFIAGEMILPEENHTVYETCQTFEADWVRVMDDGTESPISVPGECEVMRGEWVTIKTELSQETMDTWFCIRSLQQELKIYIDDELREEYSTIKTQPFGKTSTMNYVFFPVYSKDAGKTLRIELMSDSAYAGSVSEIYTGDKSEIWRYFLKLYAPATIMAAFMLILGVVVFAYCELLRFFDKRKLEIVYLGMAIIVVSTWLLAESRLRQFLLPNSTVAMYMGFFMIMLLPYPIAAYMNKIQKSRYQRYYLVIEICATVNFVLATALQIMNRKDFFETMGISHCVIILLILLLAVTFVLDIRSGHVKEYKEVAIGFLGFMFVGIWEIYLVYLNSSQYNGIALCVGLVFLLFTAGLKTARDIFRVEKEKQMAVAASESKAKFLANMSHEIRTPINTVIGMNEMILRENKDETIREYAKSIKSASQMLLGIINDVLDFSKIEAGKMQISENKYYLVTMLKEVIDGCKVRAGQKNLELKLDIDESLPTTLKGDEIRIKQILNNLLSNAVKYTKEGSVTFSAKGRQDKNGFSLIFSVADTGIGIREEDMEHLFDSFLRMELTKNRHIEGTGLGLNITKQLVDNMQGTIDVKSEYGKGSCFTVCIPQQVLEETAMGNLMQRKEREKEERGSFVCAPDAKILVVDDNKTNLTVMKALLKRSQIQVDFATGGNEALELTKNRKYDLILMDHMMPEPDGIQTLHLIRENRDNINKETKVIVLTANALEGVREQYLQEGFDDYLSKPIEVGKLEEKLAKYLANFLK